MKFSLNSILSLLAFFTLWSCTTDTEPSDDTKEQRTSIEMVTDKGTIILELYNETPRHRDNFIKLAKEGIFDGLLFHRVIENFMIQGGGRDSEHTLPGDTLRFSDLDYKVGAEFSPDLFHKKGVLAAARSDNLQRASNSLSFYIVQGKVLDDSLLTVAEDRINGWLAEHYFKNDAANKPLVDSLQKAIDNENMDRFTFFNDRIRSLAQSYENFQRYTIPTAHREVYKSIGGTPHLDQNYTVYGEVVLGLEIVDLIAAVETNSLDRPISKVRIISVRVLD